MENLKQIFNKTKFLITLIIGITLMILANKTGKFDAMFGYVILGIAILISVMQFRFYFDEKYRKQAIKHHQQQKNMHWQERYAFYPVFNGLMTFWLLSLFLIGVTVVYFFYTGITTGVWLVEETLVYLTLLFLFFITCHNSLKK